MSNEKKINNISNFIGFSAPISQKYMLVNNFLANFYPSSSSIPIYDFSDFEEIVSFDFNDIIDQNKIKVSFEEYIQSYTGITSTSAVKKKNSTVLPVHKEMLVRYFSPMRNIIFNIFNPENDNRKVKDIEQLITDFLYPNTSDEYNAIIKLLCKEKVLSKQIYRREVKIPISGNAVNNLSKDFTNDLKTMLQSENYKHFSLYKKYDYLATLFSLYSMIYIKYRLSSNAKSFSDPYRFDSNKIRFLFKGSNEAEENNRDFYRVCVRNFKNIREMFGHQFKEFYKMNMDDVKKVRIIEEDDKYFVNIDDEETIELSTFFLNRFSIKINLSYVEDYFPLDELEERNYDTDQFIKLVMNLQLKKGSSLAKISSTLQKVGKDSGLLFPRNNVIHKYYAFTPESVEFFVRLFISERNQKLSSLESFLEWLEKKYSIHVRQSKEIDDYLKRINCSLRSQEYNNNVDDLIGTMIKANCLTKLSDSGFVVTLPEDKGGAKIL